MQFSSSPKSESKSASTPPQTSTPPPSLNASFNSGSNNASNRHLLGLTPSDEVVFDNCNTSGQANGLQAKLQIKNIANKAVVFKVSPKYYYYLFIANCYTVHILMVIITIPLN